MTNRDYDKIVAETFFGKKVYYDESSQSEMEGPVSPLRRYTEDMELAWELVLRLTQYRFQLTRKQGISFVTFWREPDLIQDGNPVSSASDANPAFAICKAAILIDRP